MELNRATVEEALADIFGEPNKTRQIKLYTGVGGYDLVEEQMELYCGYERHYIGRKVARFVRLSSRAIIKKSVRGIYYKLIKIKHG